MVAELIPAFPVTFTGASIKNGVIVTVDEATEEKVLTNAFTENPYVWKFVNPIISFCVRLLETSRVVILDGVTVL